MHHKAQMNKWDIMSERILGAMVWSFMACVTITVGSLVLAGFGYPGFEMIGDKFDLPPEISMGSLVTLATMATIGAIRRFPLP